MTTDPPAGKVLVLNGASSAGKSTLARALQERLEKAGSCWVIFSWDDFVPRLPSRWCGGPGDIGDLAEHGCRYRLQEDGNGGAALLEVGDLGRRMLRGYHRAVAAVARAGISVIVEEVMITADEWQDWIDALAGLDVKWVGVRCDAEVAEQRELDRGDRYPGLAKGTSVAAHGHAVYDMEVDTTESPAEDVVRSLTDRLAAWSFI